MSKKQNNKNNKQQQQQASNTLLEPKWKERTAETHKQHVEFLQSEEGQSCKVMLFGDSMIERFNTTGRRFLPQLKDCALCGVGGDGIQNMLYRICNSLFDNTPNIQTIVIMAGTNNIEATDSPKLFEAFMNLLRVIREIKPQSRIIIFGLPPRSSTKKNLSDIKLMERVREYNKLLSTIEGTEYHDISEKLLDPATLLKNDQFYDDHVHLAENGYNIFADALEAALSSNPSDPASNNNNNNSNNDCNA